MEKTSHWRNEELRKCEEALPSLKEGDVDKASRLYKAKTGTDSIQRSSWI